MNLRTVLTDAKKALGALAVMESAAVGFGVLDSVTAGYVTAGLGVATAGVVYLLDGPDKAPHVARHPVAPAAAGAPDNANAKGSGDA